MPDYPDQVIPESLPLPIDEENDTMATPKWAQELDLEQKLAKVEANAASVKAAHARISSLSETIEAQGQLIAALELEVQRAHQRLDKARDVIQGLKGNTTRQANTQARQASRPAPKPSDRRHTCTVPNAHDEPTTHTTVELNACWQQFYAAKA